MATTKHANSKSAADVAQRNDIVMKNISRVHYIASRTRERLPRHIERGDLVNAGVLGLLEAHSNFDPGKNVQFSTFATFRIRGAMLDSLRDADVISRSLRKRGREIEVASARLEAKLGRRPGEEEIALEMKLELAHLRKLLAQLYERQPASPQVSAYDGKAPRDLIESAPSINEPDAFDLCLRNEIHLHLVKAISNLPEKEQYLLHCFSEDVKMKEIGELLGVSSSRVSQMLTATMTTLRASLAHLRERPVIATAVVVQDRIRVRRVRSAKAVEKRAAACGAMN